MEALGFVDAEGGQLSPHEGAEVREPRALRVVDALAHAV